MSSIFCCRCFRALKLYDKFSQLELEVLRQKDQQRLRQLQQTLADLEQKEKQLASDRLQRDTHSNGLTLGQSALTNIPQVIFSSHKFWMGIRFFWLFFVLLNYKPKPNPKMHLAFFLFYKQIYPDLLILKSFHSDESVCTDTKWFMTFKNKEK